MAHALVEHHDGDVPNTMEALVELPGVGRKTANVVLGTRSASPGSPWIATSCGSPIESASPPPRIPLRSSISWGRAAPACPVDQGVRHVDSARPSASASRNRCATSAWSATIATFIARSSAVPNRGRRARPAKAGHYVQVRVGTTHVRLEAGHYEPSVLPARPAKAGHYVLSVFARGSS